MTGQTDKYLGPISCLALSFANCFLMQAEEIGVPIEEVLIWGRDWSSAGRRNLAFLPLTFDTGAEIGLERDFTKPEYPFEFLSLEDKKEKH